MPLPEKKNESTKEFITRCMGDDVMKREYADADQRYAVCVRLSEDAEHNTTYKQFFGEAGYREQRETFDLKTVEVGEIDLMGPGIWNGIKFTENDLREISRNFATLKDRVKVWLTLGHSGRLGTQQRAGIPSVGWFNRLWYDAATRRLRGFLTDVPQKLAELIKAKAYRTISMEYLRRFRDEPTGKVFNRVAVGCGLLGAELPAVTTNRTLDAVRDLYTGENFEHETIEWNAHEKKKGGDKVDDLENLKEAKATTDKALRRAEEFIQKVCEKFDDCSRDELLTAIDAAVKDRDDFKAKIEKMETDTRKEKADALFSEVSGKLLPKEEENFRAVLMGSEDFDAKLTELRELFTEKKLILKKDEQAEHDPTGGKGEDFSKKPKAAEESEEFNAEEFTEDIGRELDEKGIGDTLSDESKEEFIKQHGQQEKTA